MRTALFIITAALLLSSCNEKSNIVDPSTLPKATGQVVSDTNYIQIQPPWGGFNDPKDVKVGFDDFLYVAEPNDDKIVMVNLAGTILGFSQYVMRPVAITEDRRFNLIVACEYDTTVNGSVITVAAIAKISLFNYSDSIWAAPVEIVYHESPQNKLVATLHRQFDLGREYTGVAVLPDNSYYVTRSGNNNTSSVDPDNMVLHFNENDMQYSSRLYRSRAKPVAEPEPGSSQ